MRAYKFGALALLPLLVWLSWRSRKTVTTDPAMQAAAKVLQRPISAWLLLVLIGVPFVFPDAPMVMHQTALLLALVPVLRLLPQRVFEVLGRWPYRRHRPVPAVPAQHLPGRPAAATTVSIRSDSR